MCITGLICVTGCGQNREEAAQSNEISFVEVENTALAGGEINEDVEIAPEIVEDEEEKEAHILEGESSELQDTPQEVEEEILEEPVEEAWNKDASRVKVKGIYVSGPVAGISKMNNLISLVEETELNAMVIDIKNDEGSITYKMDSPLANEVGAQIGYIRDIDELVARCKEKNIYLIARIVAFKDPKLAEAKPDLAIKLKTGGVYRDNKGLAWVNPYKKEVWEYLREIAIEAANKGFDEIQFDYIRFSTDVSSSAVDYGEEAAQKSKTDIITEFTKYICEELEPYKFFVAADVYGTVIDSKVDQNIVGQDYVQMSSYLDYICPMVYPSHYANGVYGIPIPDAEPYKTVNRAMDSANRELEVLGEGHKAIGRVWIQSFTASWVKGHISYGPKQIRDQIKGAFDAGYDEWILWNAAINYQRDSLKTEEEADMEKIKWAESKEKKEIKPTAEEAPEIIEDAPEETAHILESEKTVENATVQ